LHQVGNTYVDALTLLLSGLRVGLTPISVMVMTPPSLPVEVRVAVSWDGALVVICPSLLVVVRKWVFSKVVLREQLARLILENCAN